MSASFSPHPCSITISGAPQDPERCSIRRLAGGGGSYVPAFAAYATTQKGSDEGPFIRASCRGTASCNEPRERLSERLQIMPIRGAEPFRVLACQVDGTHRR
jgi:hypothetical protein